MINSNASKITVIKNKFYVELPDEIVSHMKLSSKDIVEFTYSNDVRLWKSEGIEVPHEIFTKLKEVFKTNDYVYQWLNKKQKYFLGKAPVSLLRDPKGKEAVIGLIERLKRGDYS